MAGANAWGLFLITISMGYGLVELPREIWNNADTNRRLTYLQYRAPKLKEEVVDIESELYEVARDIAYANRKVPSTPDGPLRNYMDVVLSKVSLKGGGGREGSTSSSDTSKRIICLY